MLENNKNTIAKLKSITGTETGSWSEDAEYRVNNDEWLRESFFVALQVIDALENPKCTQKELATRIGVAPQRISKILSGKENLTLKTIADLNKGLGISIVTNEGEYSKLKAEIEAQKGTIEQLEHQLYELQQKAFMGIRMQQVDYLKFGVTTATTQDNTIQFPLPLVCKENY